MAYLTLFCRKLPKNWRKKFQRLGRGGQIPNFYRKFVLGAPLNRNDWSWWTRWDTTLSVSFMSFAMFRLFTACALNKGSQPSLPGWCPSGWGEAGEEASLWMIWTQCIRNRQKHLSNFQKKCAASINFVDEQWTSITKSTSVDASYNSSVDGKKIFFDWK